MLGTIVEITCQDRAAITSAFEEIKKIETIANNFNPDSEISRLNAAGKIQASRDLFNMVRESLKYYRLSEGAFDITVGPVVSIWKEKIMEAENKTRGLTLPTESRIKKAVSLVGSDKISLDDSASSMRFTQSGMSIDLGAIAKGYAVDKAVRRLKELGVRSALVNAGGNVYCLGKKGSRKWRIGVRHPRKSAEVVYYLDLENQGAATSGDYEQFFILDKKRYSHIINPKTGWPVDNNISSVTIIAPDAATSDGLSTTVFILGKEKGLTLTGKIEGVEVKILEN
ncbi:MAG: FAD:protein FMN transferase [Candidatus Omnitrophota bacterium]